MTQLYSDVVSPPTHGRRVALFSVARLQSAGAGSGLETKRSALGAHVSVNKKYNIPAHSGRLFAARPEAVSVGSDTWVLRDVQRTQRVSSRRQTTTTEQ